MKTLLLSSVLFAGLLGSLTAFPASFRFQVPVPYSYHAFCRTLWLVGSPCTDVNTAMIEQIQAYNPMIGCENCQYMLVSATARTITANHTSPDGLQAENITLTFTPTKMTVGCRVTAQSTSLGFTSLIDNGLNYCNLYNLVSASGLMSAPGFMEMTNEWACLGYGLATCTA